jgi:hypothetical protein
LCPAVQPATKSTVRVSMASIVFCLIMWFLLKVSNSTIPHMRCKATLPGGMRRISLKEPVKR